VRWAIALLLILAMTTLAGCGGNDKSAAPLPIAQRFITANEAPGSKPDPDEARQVTKDFDDFLAALNEQAINPKKTEIAKAFRRADFQSAGIDLRFYGKQHIPGSSTHVGSSFVALKSRDGAIRALDWLAGDSGKPCPKSCATRINTFDVDDLPDGRGVRRIATAEDIKSGGFVGENPGEHYWVGFAIGDLVYTVDLFGRPGAVSEKQVLEIANAYYDRLNGS
jgi:hypothetical protein